MKKITSIKQLRAEKKQLLQRRHELEKAIKYDWLDVRKSLMPGNVSDQVFSKVFHTKEQDEKDSVVAEGVSQVAASLTKKIVGKAENKIGKWLKRK